MAENGSKQRRYDISMLRDFLDHLLCELRVEHSNLDKGSEATAAEWTAQQEVYRKKYHTTGLLERNLLQNDVESASEFDAASASFAAMFAEMRAVEIKRLEELQGLFDEVLRCCRQEEKPARTFSAAEMLSTMSSSQE